MRRLSILVAMCAVLLAACAQAAPEPTATPTETETPVPSETPTATLSPTRSAPTLPPEPTDTPTLTPSITNTHVTATFIPTNTKIPTSTLTFTPSLTNTPTFTPTVTYTPSATPTLSFTPLPDSAVVAQGTSMASRPFGAHIGYVVVGQRVGFLDLSHGPTAESWLWDFGDGATSTLRSPNHRYADIGRYVVTLTIRGPSGVSAAVRAVEAVQLSCRISPRGRIRVRAQPADSASVAYLLDPAQTIATTRAVQDEAGAVWYFVDFVNGWIRQTQVNVIDGICPIP